MADYTPFSPRASLIAVGCWMHEHGLWEIIGEHVQIKQKVIFHTPLDKLKDTFIDIAAGGHGVVEVNTRVRPDKHLQQAFDRSGCADQSTVSDTLNACAEKDVEGMRAAQSLILSCHSGAYQHEYSKEYQLLDVDLTGMPAGRALGSVGKDPRASRRRTRTPCRLWRTLPGSRRIRRPS